MTALDLTKTATTAGAWAWKLLENPFIDFLKRRLEDAKSDSEKAQYLQARWNEFDWGKAAERYQDRMKDLHGQIRVLGSTEPQNFDDLFTDVYILDKPLAFRRFDIIQLHELQRQPEKLEQSNRSRGLDIVSDNKIGHRLYILGQPGAGKTTFLKYLVHQTIEESLGRISIFVTIRDWADSGLEVIDFIAKQFDICKFPNAYPFIEYILDTGRALLLFDGLDEVRQGENLRGRIITSLHDFCRKYFQTRVIITCRVAAINYSFTEFTYVELAEFTEKQIEAYAGKWFGIEVKKKEQFLDEIKKPTNKGVKELGRSPLLLSMICLAYNERLSIPKRKLELYEDALDALLKKWDSSQRIQRDEVYKKLFLGRKKQMFALIAAEYFWKGDIFFPTKQLARKIERFIESLPPIDNLGEVDGEGVLEAIEAQHGILVERAQGIYAFSHLTFQEYYTAKYITDNAYRGAIKRSLKYLTDDRWEIVFQLTASILDEADKLFLAMHKFTSDFFQESKLLINIQKQIEQKSEKVAHFRKGAVRGMYWFIFLGRALANDLTLSDELSIIHADALDLAFTPSLDLPLARARSSDFNPHRNKLILAGSIFGYSLDQVLDDALKTVMDMVNALDFEYLEPLEREETLAILLDICLIHGDVIFKNISVASNSDFEHKPYSKLVRYYEYLRELSQKIDAHLYQSLIRLSLPPENGLKVQWGQFSKDFRLNLVEFRGIGHDWRLDKEHINLLKLYFQATRLILDCLEVARVRDREAILSKILTVEQ